MVLMRALEGRDPQGVGGTVADGLVDLAYRLVEMATQMARRPAERRERLQPDQRRRGFRLGTPASQPPRVPTALPRPQRPALRHAGSQVQHEHARPGGEGARRGDAAGNDLVVGMRRQD